MPRSLILLSCVVLIALAPAARADGCQTSGGTSFAPVEDAASDALRAADSVIPTQVPPCPSALTSDECSLYQRYHAALAKLAAEGKNPPTRIADAIAPRFIEPWDWEDAKKKGIGDPAKVYDPAPETWDFWDKARQVADAQAAANFQKGKIPALTLTGLLKIHTAGMGDLLEAGNLRKREESGMAIERDSAPSLDEIKTVRHFEYKSIRNPEKAIVQWHPKQCEEDWKRPADEILTFPLQTSRLPNLSSSKQTFTDSSGVVRQCGYFDYAPAAEVRPQLKNWMSDLNRSISSINQAGNQAGNQAADPVAVAARAQRWLISIHPFTKGNGRTSRLVMDMILESEGLPAPVLANPEKDIGTPGKQWSVQVEDGVRRTVEILENCAKPEHRADPGCQVVR